MSLANKGNVMNEAIKVVTVLCNTNIFIKYCRLFLVPMYHVIVLKIVSTDYDEEVISQRHVCRWPYG